jgi:O-antigen/teichoic acid export membrane protein
MDKSKDKGEVLKNALIVVLLGTLILAILSPLVKLYGLFNDWYLYFTIITVVLMVRGVLSLYVKGSGKTRLFAIDSIIYTFILAVLNIVLLLIFDIGIIGYFLSTILATVISILFLFISSKAFSTIKRSKINVDLLKEMVRYSTPLMINAISWWIMSSSDRFMLEYFYSASQVGIYSIAIKFPSILISIVSIFNQAWAISSINEYESTKDKSFYSKTFSLYYFNLVLISALMIPLVEPFINIYVNGDYIEAWRYIPFLIIGAIFQSFSSFFGTIYSSAKKNLNTMTSSLLSAILNITLNLFLIPKFGIMGAVIATMIAYIMIGVFRMYDTRRFFSFYINFKLIYCTISLLIVQSIIVLFVEDLNFLAILVAFIILILNRKEFLSIISMIRKLTIKI